MATAACHLIAASFFKSTRLTHSCNSFGSWFCNLNLNEITIGDHDPESGMLAFFLKASKPGLPSMVTDLP